MTYEYKCRICGWEIERDQRISEEPLTHCPGCDQETLEKQINWENKAIGFIGDGWECKKGY